MVVGNLSLGLAQQAGLAKKQGQKASHKVCHRTVCIYSCYCPFKVDEPGSVYTQHLAYHQAQHKLDFSPIKLSIRDLGKELKQVKSQDYGQRKAPTSKEG